LGRFHSGLQNTHPAEEKIGIHFFLKLQVIYF